MSFFYYKYKLRTVPVRAFPALMLAALALPGLFAAPSPEKEACFAAVRERHRQALAECLKKPFGTDRNRCRERADSEEAAGRAACRKLRPPQDPYQKPGPAFP